MRQMPTNEIILPSAGAQTATATLFACMSAQNLMNMANKNMMIVPASMQIEEPTKEGNVDKMPSNNFSPTNKTSSPSSILDGMSDCVVCGASASGVHYMVWSCNGCKTFFRRAIMENRKYSCARNGDCPIDVKNRCCCRHCRFAKCIRVGMTFTEINVERKRRIHMTASSYDGGEKMPKTSEHPVILELLAKEKRFRILLTSTLTPTYGTLSQMLEGPSIFNSPMGIYENFQIAPVIQMDFYEWRARILSIIAEWIKSFPEFMTLPPIDQQAIVVHSAFALLVLSEAFHTPERFADRLVYPDGTQVTRNFSKGICIPQNGLIRGIVAVINYILAPIRRIQLTEVEYVLLQALILFDPDCLSLSEQCQKIVRAKREQVLIVLHRHARDKFPGNAMESANSVAQLLLRIPNIQKVAAFKAQFFREGAQQMLGDNCVRSSLAIELANLYPNVSFF